MLLKVENLDTLKVKRRFSNTSIGTSREGSCFHRFFSYTYLVSIRNFLVYYSVTIFRQLAQVVRIE